MVLLVSMMASKAQEPLSYDFVIAKDGVSAEQIYTQLIDWIATDFKSALNPQPICKSNEFQSSRPGRCLQALVNGF